MPLYDGCLDEGIRIVDVRHEQAAVHAADAWARCNPGTIGVAAITAGPGVTDGVTGIANAWRANSPILVFGGQGPFANLRRGSLQEMDHVGVVRPITKYADAVYQTTASPSTSSWRSATRCRASPGPAYLEIPMDVFMGQVRVGGGADPAHPHRAAAPLARSRRGAPRDRAARARAAPDADGRHQRQVVARERREMNRFIDETHIPTYTNGMGRGTVPPTRREFLNRSRRDALKQIDCVILAGTLLDFRMAFGKTIPADAKIIQLDMDATLIGQNRADRRAAWSATSRCSFELLLEEMKNQGVRLDFYGLARRAARDRDRGRAEGRGGAQQRRGADRPAAHVPRGARLARRRSTTRS